MNFFSLFLDGLHESRRLQAERELRRHAHLIADAQARDPRLERTAAAEAEGAPQLDGGMEGVPA